MFTLLFALRRILTQISLTCFLDSVSAIADFLTTARRESSDQNTDLSFLHIKTLIDIQNYTKIICSTSEYLHDCELVNPTAD